MNSSNASWSRHLNASPLYWACQVAFWGAFWLTDMPEINDFGHLTYPLERFFFHAWEFVSGILITHVWRGWMRQHNWHLSPLDVVIWRLVFGCLILAFVHQLVSGWPRVSPSASMPFHIVAVVAIDFLLIDAVKMVGWTSVYFGFHSHQQLASIRLRQSELASASRAAALASLRAQVHPHFLFNSLNTLRYLIAEDPKHARDTVTQLSKILRYSLRHSETSLVPLRDEWEVVEAYLQIESARFEQRLCLNTDIEPESLDHLVPPLLLQTLVENAVKFGVSPSETGANIRIESRLQGPNVILTVSNSGALVFNANTTSLGLSNARQRLALLFGDEASLELREHAGWVIATVILPITLRS
jgi:hypothetical protein